MPTPRTGIEHLWIVLTDPEPVTSLAVCVNITSRQSYSEITVILHPDDHPFITHESVIPFADALILAMDKVQQLIDAHPTQFTCIQHASCRDELLEQIRQGLLSSEMTPNKIKDYCRKSWGWYA